MATTEQEQQKLIDTLKFTPRTYKIQMWGYGGEKVMGTTTQEVWDYCMTNQVDLSDIAWDSDAAEEIGLDADKLPFPPGSWYECDDMGHINGVSRDSGTVQIEDENGETVYEHDLGEFDYDEPCPDLCCDDEVWIGSRSKGEIVFVGSSNEKGTFFEGEIELTAPFDITKLGMHYDEFDGEEIVTSVYYDGEEINNWGGSTDGKSSDFVMARITDDLGNWERYEPGEKDWGTPECGFSPSEWEKSPTFDFKNHKPVYVGWYNCVWGNYGTTYGSAYWDGTEFVEFEYGKSRAVPNVRTWSGYNWDTTSWANQPPTPPNVICDNKSCNWVGLSDDRITDDDYNDHCPECNGTEFSWIDYDLDTKEGQVNRDKYCIPAMPVAPELTRKEKAELIAGLDRALEQLAKESGIEFEDGPGSTVAPKGSWPF